MIHDLAAQPTGEDADRFRKWLDAELTLGRIDHGANFDLIVGKWGEQTSSADRSAVSVAFQRMPEGPQFMVIDAVGRPGATPGTLADSALRRDQVIGTPLAQEVFALLDAVWLNDERIGELTRPAV